MTPYDIIADAFPNAGVGNIGQTIPAKFITMAFDELNAMLQLWSIEGMLIPTFIQDVLTLASAKGSYTIGLTTPVSDFNTARPVKIVSAFIRESNVDTDLNVYNNLNQYNSYSEKTTQGKPGEAHYDPLNPAGKIYFYYTPDKTYSLYLTSEKYITSFATPGETITLPPETRMLLSLSLAVILMGKFGTNNALIIKRAQDAKNAFIVNNSKKDICNIRVDSALLVNPRR